MRRGRRAANVLRVQHQLTPQLLQTKPHSTTLISEDPSFASLLGPFLPLKQRQRRQRPNRQALRALPLRCPEIPRVTACQPAPTSPNTAESMITCRRSGVNLPASGTSANGSLVIRARLVQLPAVRYVPNQSLSLPMRKVRSLR